MKKTGECMSCFLPDRDHLARMGCPDTLASAEKQWVIAISCMNVTDLTLNLNPAWSKNYTYWLFFSFLHLNYFKTRLIIILLYISICIVLSYAVDNDEIVGTTSQWDARGADPFRKANSKRESPCEYCLSLLLSWSLFTQTEYTQTPSR